MSKALDFADKMAEYLESVPALGCIDVIVDRQKDITNEVMQAIEKSKGAAIVILYVGGKNNNPEHHGILRKTCKYAVTVETLAILRDDESATADDLVEVIQSALHGWKHLDELHCFDALRVLGDEMVPDQNFLRIDIQVEVDLTINVYK